MLSFRRLFRKTPRATSKTPVVNVVPGAPSVPSLAPVPSVPVAQSSQPKGKLTKRVRRGLKKAWSKVLRMAEHIFMSAHRARGQLVLEQRQQATVIAQPTESAESAIAQSNNTVFEVDQPVHVESPIEAFNSPTVQSITTGPLSEVQDEKPKASQQSYALIVYEDLSSFISTIARNNQKVTKAYQSNKVPSRMLPIDHPLMAALLSDRRLFMDMLTTIKVDISIRIPY